MYEANSDLVFQSNNPDDDDDDGFGLHSQSYLMGWTGFWSHYTESMDFSVSMTYRFWNQQQAKALHKS